MNGLAESERREIRIKTAPSYSWRQQMDFLRRYPPDLMYRLVNGRLERAVDLGNFIWLISVRPLATDEIAVCCLNGEPTERERLQLREFVSEWLDLERDITPFYELAEQDPLLAPIVKKYRGLQIIGLPSLFEALCWAIIGQQVNISFAYALKNRLVEQFGSFILWHGKPQWVFPLPQLIAKLEVADLTPLKLSRGKAAYLIGIARLIAEGTLTKEQLAEEPNVAEAAKLLMRLNGVGQWTADYVLMKSLRRADSFPAADAGVQNAVKAQLGLAEKPTVGELQERAKGWSGWQAYAALYLWRTLFADGDAGSRRMQA